MLTTPAAVIPVLVGGADLMVPGGARDPPLPAVLHVLSSF